MKHSQLVKWLREHDDRYVMIETINDPFFADDTFDISLSDSEGCVEGVRAETIEEGLTDLCNILAERGKRNDRNTN